ncbi:quinon protein alcohol dehydrogenase-like superfamily [Aspergillus avenaceus]|uniref:Quinon protein alcohol dehydrogenase-like superfamily n=1 Tax=Aspergillus avenaceus TaxID=36643 RepID=A0A5N6U9V0_ASPAV|nr:quinon protein alcohol dehydrogenase-like superfamily [Aspergillus avenaceus]
MAAISTARIHDNRAYPGSFQINNTTTLSSQPTPAFDPVAEDCLRQLECPDPRVVKNRLMAHKDYLQPKSIEWFFGSTELRKWNSGRYGCLWIKGGAKKGKTMMAIGLIEQRLEFSRHDNNTVTLFFFCQYHDKALNTIAAVIKGLIRLLVNEQRNAKVVLKQRCYANYGGRDISLWETLWDMLLEMLDTCECPEICVVIDGLDECQDKDKANFLRLLVHTGSSRSPRVQWILTSRPLNLAEQIMLRGPEIVQVDLEYNSVVIAAAVDSYITAKVHDLALLYRYNEVEQYELQSQLSEQAEGTYLWVSLIFKELETASGEEALKAIMEVQPGLTDIYERAFAQISEGPPDVVKKRKRLIKTVAVSYKPLTVEEVTYLMDQERELHITDLIDRCGSILKIKDKRVHFVHRSARDYFTKEDQGFILDPDGIFDHAEIAKCCLEQLFRRLKCNIINLPSPDCMVTGPEKPEAEHPITLANIEYAATFWAQHLVEDKDNDIIQKELTSEGRVGQFLKIKLLEWLECLSLLRKLHVAKCALQSLATIINEPVLSSVVQDAMRFLLRHSYTLENWPLQVYSSAVIFSPATSFVRRHYLHQLYKWLIRPPRTEHGWSSPIMTLRGHEGMVNTVAISPDGGTIVSGSIDQTIKMWDFATGNCEKNISQKSRSSGKVTAVTFSKDGKQFASASTDGYITFWDSNTGDIHRAIDCRGIHIRTMALTFDGKNILTGDRDIRKWNAMIGVPMEILDYHEDWIQAVAVSNDNKRVVSGSGDGIIKLWDASRRDDRENPMTLRGHSSKLNAVAFSPNGDFVISGSTDKTSIIWDAITGSPVKTMKAQGSPNAHFNEVNTVCVLPNGEYIITGSSDKTIKVWDTTAGELQTILADHTDSVCELAFSTDSKYIISGSADSTIKVWGVRPLDPENVLTDHSSWVNAVTFSSDGQKVASGSFDNTIKVWDFKTGDLEMTLFGHTKQILLVAFSANGSQIASADADATIKLWDIATGKLVRTMYHSDRIQSLAISPNGDHIVSGALDGSIKLWNCSEDIFLQQPWRPRPVIATAVVFSPDGTRIASGCSDGTVKIWNVLTGVPVVTLSSHSKEVKAVAFTPDGKNILSGSLDCSMKLWESSKDTDIYVEFADTTAKSSRPAHSPLTLYEPNRTWSFSEPIKSLKFIPGNMDLTSNLGVHDPKDKGLVDGVWVRESWICFGPVGILRLPEGFKPRCHDVRDNRIVIGCTNGRVLFFEFDARAYQIYNYC